MTQRRSRAKWRASTSPTLQLSLRMLQAYPSQSLLDPWPGAALFCRISPSSNRRSKARRAAQSHAHLQKLTLFCGTRGKATKKGQSKRCASLPLQYPESAQGRDSAIGQRAAASEQATWALPSTQPFVALKGALALRNDKRKRRWPARRTSLWGDRELFR